MTYQVVVVAAVVRLQQPKVASTQMHAKEFFGKLFEWASCQVPNRESFTSNVQELGRDSAGGFLDLSGCILKVSYHLLNISINHRALYGPSQKPIYIVLNVRSISGIQHPTNLPYWITFLR